MTLAPKLRLAYVVPKEGSNGPAVVNSNENSGEPVSKKVPFPQGTVTFFFTDIEASTQLLNTLGSRYATVLQRQREIVREAIESSGGRFLDSEGDGNFAAFARAIDAISASNSVQEALRSEDWAGPPPLVRIGIHTGDSTYANGSYVGVAVHKAQRICSAAHGGQILISEATRTLVGDALPQIIEVIDLGHHRLKDLGQPERLFQVTDKESPRDFPPLRTLESTPNNLPAQLTSFVGRTEEMPDLQALIGRSRLVTVIGAGGSGKTRLALQVAAESLESFPDGVWFVDLSATSDPSHVPQTVSAAVFSGRDVSSRASMFGTADGTSDPKQKILAELKPLQCLLVLDNCEHLVAAAAEIGESLLLNCPNLSLLVTSRESLGVPGEIRWQIPTLSVPLISDDLTVEEALQHDAVQLFSERAALNRPGFELLAEDLKPIVEICRRLDGLPLGIELAAAWVHALSPQQILDRLDDQFRLLSSSVRGAPTRQQTLRAAVDWSYELLSLPERRLLEALCVFPSQFSLDAAETICSDEMIGAGEVLSLLATLINKSLVIREGEGASARYRLLETIRQYGRDKLSTQQEAETNPESFRPIPSASMSGLLPAFLRRDGEYWTVGVAKDVALLRDIKGLSLLRILLSDPGKEWHVLDLVIETEGHAVPATAGAETQPVANDSLEVIDPEARMAYKNRLRELQEEIEDAESMSDIERASKLRGEMEWIASWLAGSTGLGGRSRTTNSSSDRARVSVTKALRAAIKKIATQHPALGTHLNRSIFTGTFCSYRPEAPTFDWKL